jgi:hypothetical protein
MRYAQVLQNLPWRVLGAIGPLAALGEREVADGGIKVRVRMAAVEQFEQMLPQTRVAIDCARASFRGHHDSPCRWVMQDWLLHSSGFGHTSNRCNHFSRAAEPKSAHQSAHQVG